MPVSIVAAQAVVVMGKLPEPGKVKTRLLSLLSEAEAAEVYRRFLSEVLALVDSLPSQVARYFCCPLRAGDLEKAQKLVPEGFEILPQSDGDLGERMEKARQDAQAEAVVIIGSDAPAMKKERLQDAFEALQGHSNPRSVVIGPTEDGGYDLIGLRTAALELMTDMPWSTEQVLPLTRSRAENYQIPLLELSLAYDIDHPQDLARLRQDPHCPPRLHNYLQQLAKNYPGQL